MQTLYDVLGLGGQATEQQIEHAYKLNLDTLTGPDNVENMERNAIRAKAVKEAYSILSSPIRRQNYDANLKKKPVAVSYEIVEKAPFPWMWIIVGLLIIGATFLYYTQQRQRAEIERQAIAAEQAKAEADRAEQEAISEQAKIAQQKIFDQRQADRQRDAEMNTSRREGQMIQIQNQRMEDQIARDKARDEQHAAQAAQIAANAPRLARMRSDAEIAAMRRALAIPITKSNSIPSQ
jgi:curved DNA-binding protein CbpA